MHRAGCAPRQYPAPLYASAANGLPVMASRAIGFFCRRGMMRSSLWPSRSREINSITSRLSIIPRSPCRASAGHEERRCPGVASVAAILPMWPDSADPGDNHFAFTLDDGVGGADKIVAQPFRQAAGLPAPASGSDGLRLTGKSLIFFSSVTITSMPFFPA